MKILRNLEVPTGNILVVEGELGKLECLSLGDYGKDVNIKCEAMGLTRNIDKVEHQKMLPLSLLLVQQAQAPPRSFRSPKTEPRPRPFG